MEPTCQLHPSHFSFFSSSLSALVGERGGSSSKWQASSQRPAEVWWRRQRASARVAAADGAVALEPEAAEVEVEATTPTSPSEPSTHALVTPTRRTARARSRAAAPPGMLLFSFLSSLFAGGGQSGDGRERMRAERPTTPATAVAVTGRQLPTPA